MKTRFAFAFVLMIILTSCSTKNDPVISSTKTAGSLKVSFTTSTYNGNYSPRHVLAVWIEDGSGNYVKTLLVNAAARRYDLNKWTSNNSATNTTDAVTGATLNQHTSHSCTWNGTDAARNVVGNGTYQVWIEFNETSGSSKYASFSFTKDSISDSLSPSDKSGISAISLQWTPN